MAVVSTGLTRARPQDSTTTNVQPARSYFRTASFFKHYTVRGKWTRRTPSDESSARSPRTQTATFASVTAALEQDGFSEAAANLVVFVPLAVGRVVLGRMGVGIMRDEYSHFASFPCPACGAYRVLTTRVTQADSLVTPWVNLSAHQASASVRIRKCDGLGVKLRSDDPNAPFTVQPSGIPARAALGYDATGGRTMSNDYAVQNRPGHVPASYF